jgi:hypothetical protein
MNGSKPRKSSGFRRHSPKKMGPSADHAELLARCSSFLDDCASFRRDGATFIRVRVSLANVEWRLASPIFRRWIEGQAHARRVKLSEADIHALLAHFERAADPMPAPVRDDARRDGDGNG